MGSRQYRDSRGSTGTTNPVRPRKKGDAIAPTRLRKKKTFSQEWVHLYGNTEKLPCWCLLEETITLGTYKCFFFLLFCFFHAGHHFIVGAWKKKQGRQTVAWDPVSWDTLSCHGEAAPFQASAISLANSEKMGRGAVRRIGLTPSAIVSAPEFNLNVNLYGQDMNRMLSIKIYPAG